MTGHNVISLVQVTSLGSSETRTHTRKMSRWGFCEYLDGRSSQGDNKSCSKNKVDTVIFMIIPIYFTESIRWFWPYGHQCNCISLYIEYHISLALNVHYVLVEQSTHGKKVTFKMITNILLKFTKVIMASFGNEVNYTALNTPKHKSPFLNLQNFKRWTRHTSWKGNIQD